MRFFRQVILFFYISVCISLLASNLQAKPVVAFGYMHNLKNDPEFGYLEIILSNSFANSINAVFDVDVKKPLQLEKELAQEGDSLKKDYEFFDLPEFIKKINSDLFVFGSFEPLSNNRIKIILNIYMSGHSEIFSFTNIGRMETQISKLMDRISIVIINFMGEHSLYKTRKILPGTRLAVLTNLEGAELNSFLLPFLEKGYPVICFQANELHNIVDDSSVNKFDYIKTMNNSYDRITDWRKTKFDIGTWHGERQKEYIDYMREMYRKYDQNYELTNNAALDRLSNIYDNRIDILLIAAFSENRKTSQVRAVDLRGKELIWIQSNIKSIGPGKDRVADNAARMLEAMVAEPVNPFKKLDESSASK